MAALPDDEIRFILNAMRWIDADVTSRLWTRGWVVADLAVGEGESLEWFWPPTAPVGYGGLPEGVDEILQRRPQMFGPRQTPWTRPTRITGSGTVWTLKYGEATAQTPAAPRHYANTTALISDLERIECWPMTVEETHEIRAVRVFDVTTAIAHDDHYVAVFPTEPYASRGNVIRAHQQFEHARSQGATGVEPPAAARIRGDLRAQSMLVEADAWASAVRTARAGGDGWDATRPEET